MALSLTPPCVIYLWRPYCRAFSEGVAQVFVLEEAQRQCILGPFLRQGLLFQGGERIRAGLTSVCVQSQAGPEHSVPWRPPSPLPGGLCSRFHAIRAAACFPAQSCQGHKRPWVGSHQEGWAWKIGKMYHKAHPLDGCLALCGGVSRPSSPCTFLFPFSLAELHLSLCHPGGQAHHLDEMVQTN